MGYLSKEDFVVKKHLTLSLNLMFNLDASEIYSYKTNNKQKFCSLEQQNKW